LNSLLCAELPLPQLKSKPNLFDSCATSIKFSTEDALWIKETVTNHDVKAVEYFIKELLKN
jgi:adenylosuccinate lyase